MFISRLIFKNYGGSYQLKIQDAMDMKKIQVLDEVHWAATSIPINSLNCDYAFLSYIDTDKNGRIRTAEFKAALAWLFRFLVNPCHLHEGTDILRLSDIDISHSEGRKLRSAAELILTNLNLPDIQEITLSQIRDVQRIMAKAANNGDGIIPPEAAGDSDLAQFIILVMETIGSVPDAGGKPGIGQEQLETFFREAEDYLSWKAKGEISKEDDATEIMPWGDETPQAYELVAGLDEKIEEYFIQCAIAGLDQGLTARIEFYQKKLEKIDFTDKSMMKAWLENSPLSLPDPKGILDLEGKINPLYAGCLTNLRKKVLKRALKWPAKQLSEEQWNEVKDIFAPYRLWLENKQRAKVEKVGSDKLRMYLNDSYKDRVGGLIAKDAAVAGYLEQIHNIEKLILYQRWLMELANNFVSFASLYNPKRHSFFEMGMLVIEGREINFTMKVQDRLAHKKIAENSHMYLLYVEVTGRRNKDISFSTALKINDEENQAIKFEIAAPVTSGEGAGLYIGKRGIFFTVDGREWDAQIVDIVENPITPWESVRAPFKQLAGFVRKQIDKFNKVNQDKMEAAFSSPNTSGAARDLLLGGSVAIAALGSSFAYVTKALSQVKFAQILIMLIGVTAVILVPGIVISFVKIRKRDMSVLLEASGWAVNVRMRLNTALGRLFTHLPPLPKSARKERKDVVTHFVKELGCFSFRFRRLTAVVLVIILVLLGLIFFLFTQPQLKVFLVFLRPVEFYASRT